MPTRPIRTAACLFLILVCTSAVGPAAAETASRFAETPSITTTGDAERSVAYDRADIRLVISCDAPSAQEAADQIATRAQRLHTALKALQLPANALSTPGPTVSDRYETVQRGQKMPEDFTREKTGSQARQTFRVELADMTRVDDVIKAASAAGVDDFRVWYQVSNHQEIMRSLEAQATRNALTHAARLADAAKARLGRILTIEPPRMDGVADLAALNPSVHRDEPVSFVVVPGTTTIKASIEVMVELITPGSKAR